MKINNLFVLRSVAGEHLLIPTGSAAASIQGLISLNETGALLYSRLEGGCTEAELVSALTAEYDVSSEEAAADVSEFLEQMAQLGILTADRV